MTGLTFGSLFAGVGGMDLGFEQAGFDCRFQVEWDKHCQQVLGYRWPTVPKWGDVSEVNGAELPPVDVITYGFPCQDLSVAGKRAGLDGGRSGLFFEAVRIIREMREATDGRYPTFAVAENVPGLLSADGGAAMGRCLDELAEAGALVIEWCVLDAQWFGVPQRRRRVFLAACFGSDVADRCPDPLFPIAEGSARNPAEIKSSRQEVAGTLGGGSGQRGWSPDTDRMTFIPYTQSSFGGYTEGFGTLSATDHKRPEQHVVPFVKVVRSGARDENGDLPPEVWREERVSPTLNQFDVGDTRSVTVVASGLDDPIGFSHTQGLDPQPSSESFPTLRSGGGGHAVSAGGLNVRRLMPVECERLMGWPDDHTLYRADGKLTADSQRYKMCGNGVVAPVARWVAKHLAAVIGTG